MPGLLDGSQRLRNAAGQVLYPLTPHSSLEGQSGLHLESEKSEASLVLTPHPGVRCAQTPITSVQPHMHAQNTHTHLKEP